MQSTTGVEMGSVADGTAMGRNQAAWFERLSIAGVHGDAAAMSQRLADQDLEVDMLGDLTRAELVSVAGMSVGDAIRVADYDERPEILPQGCEKAIDKIPIVNFIYDLFFDCTPTYEGVEQLLNILALISALVTTGMI